MNFIDLGLPSGTCWGGCNILAKWANLSGAFLSYRTLTDPDAVEDSHFYSLGPVNKLTGYPSIKLIPVKDMFRMMRDLAYCVPTQEQMTELVSSCTWKKEVYGIVWGFRATSRYNHKSIFFPSFHLFPNHIVQQLSLVQSAYDDHRITGRDRFYSILDCESLAIKSGRSCCQYLTRSTDSHFAPLGWSGGVMALTVEGDTVKATAKVTPVSRDTWLPIRPVINR